MQSLVIDNFLPYPNVIREWVMQQSFYNSEEFSKRIGQPTNWPGKRTDHVLNLDRAYADDVLTKVAGIAKHAFRGGDLSIRSYFQLCIQQDGDSWVHQDNDVDIAAVLYLTPDAPVSAGTSLYRCLDPGAWGRLSMEDMTKINREERHDLYNTLFEPVDVIGNVYNRLIMYRGDIFHKSNDYFGTTKYNGRMTQVFFIKYE